MSENTTIAVVVVAILLFAGFGVRTCSDGIRDTQQAQLQGAELQLRVQELKLKALQCADQDVDQ